MPKRRNPCRPAGDLSRETLQGGDMAKFLDYMFSPSLGWPMLCIGVVLLLSRPIVWMQEYLMSFGIFIFPTTQGLMFVLMSIAILYLSNKNKVLYKSIRDSVGDADIIQTNSDKSKNLRDMKDGLLQVKSELEQARQEKAALQAELEKTRAELEKARQAEGVNPKSRNTYLKVIAALANRNGKIDLHERGAAVTISRATENFGFPVSEDTTRKIIKEIEELQK